MNIVFTDIDGVLNTVNRNKWNENSVDLYNSLCEEFNLHPVITSTWRINHTIDELQKIFNKTYSKFIIIDDNIRDLLECGLPNIIKCRSWIGFSKDEYDLARKILK